MQAGTCPELHFQHCQQGFEGEAEGTEPINFAVAFRKINYFSENRNPVVNLRGNMQAQITSLDSKSSRSLLELICNPKPDLRMHNMWRSIVRPVIFVKGRGERNEVTKLKVLMERFKFMIEIQ
ncbi:hypothetical protein T05_2732 [Trichinella murrelli]|uniref:Uncharacterized protein n=1 Tax=Trichinella murrelli TaxID=144512 RepID=A0A0V0TJ36_9BILA|nr:hypothetical protein T05_2732 [Trichinella murrelli]